MKQPHSAFYILAFGLAIPFVACSSSDSAQPGTTTGPGGVDAGDGGGGGGGGGGNNDAGGTDGGNPVSGKNAACPNKTKPVVEKTYYTLTADETWTAGNVYMVGGFAATGSHKLTIEAGATICIVGGGPPGTDRRMIEIGENGTIEVNGTADAPVVFTVDPATADEWGGFNYDPQSKPSTIQNAEFYYAGGSAYGGLITSSPKPDGAKLDWRNVQAFEYQRNPIQGKMAGFSPETSITVHYAKKLGATAQQAPAADYYYNYPVLKIRPEYADTVTANTIIVDPASPTPTKYIEIDNAGGEKLDQDVKFHKTSSGLTHLFRIANFGGSTSAPNTWTIDPGVHVAIASSGSVSVAADGSGKTNVVAVGTAADPIVFTSASPFETGKAPAAGDWSTITFKKDGFDPAITKFDYVHFEYGGSSGTLNLFTCDDLTVGGFLGFDMGLGSEKSPGFSITNSSFSNSSGQAIRVRGRPPLLATDYRDPAFKNTFTNIATLPAEYVGNCP